MGPLTTIRHNPQMTELSKAENRKDAIVDAVAAIVLSVAALLTSWASFQSALWDGEQAANYTRAGTARVQASLLATENGQSEAVDLVLFTQWLNAYAAKDRRLQDFYHERFRPEFRRAFDTWRDQQPLHNGQAAHSPFVMKEYAPALAQKAAAADKRADALFDEGQRCNDVSDAYVAATVILALALFLAGIGQSFDRRHLTAALTLLAGLACVFGLIQLISLPTLSLG
ncbi:hypothetical protein [Novosphingobium sp. G106]|uniref:hypothetical protein n=1 Tax=Novosphingobium sp. G106 TaxID=2849500 RepID=UPI0020C1F541|nr:hypothetical protein [Novosphingobium sp. G106]